MLMVADIDLKVCAGDRRRDRCLAGGIALSRRLSTLPVLSENSVYLKLKLS